MYTSRSSAMSDVKQKNESASAAHARTRGGPSRVCESDTRGARGGVTVTRSCYEVTFLPLDRHAGRAGGEEAVG